MSEFSPKVQAFIEGVVGHGNAPLAYTDAGSAKQGAAQGASRLLTNVKVAAEIARRRAEVVKVVEEKTGITLAKVIEQLARIGWGDAARMFSAEGKPLGIQEIPDDTRPAIAGFEVVDKLETSGSGENLVVTPVRTTKLRMADKVAPLLAIGKHLGGFKERLEVEDVTPPAALVPTLSDADLAKVRAAIDAVKAAAVAAAGPKRGRRG